MVATSPDDFDGLDLNGIAAASPSIPHKLESPSTELPIKDTPLNEKLRIRATLANLGWDCTAKSLHLPALTENGEWIYRCTDHAGINDQLARVVRFFSRCCKRAGVVNLDSARAVADDRDNAGDDEGEPCSDEHAAGGAVGWSAHAVAQGRLDVGGRRCTSRCNDGGVLDDVTRGADGQVDRLTTRHAGTCRIAEGA